jgi:hypothetical protein
MRKAYALRKDGWKISKKTGKKTGKEERMIGWVDKEVCFVPLSSLCRECEEERDQCSLYRPRMASEDDFPWGVCGGFRERFNESSNERFNESFNGEEEAWEK